MSLWPGYYMGKELAEPVLTDIPKVKIYQPEHEPDLKIETVSGNFYPHLEPAIRTANGSISLEDFGAGEAITWMFPYDEFHWIIKGKAEMIYSLAGTSHTEQKTVHIEEGDIYLLPLGSRVTWKVDPSGPLRKICVVIPGVARSTKQPDKVHKLK
ncbi:cupin domain-containing protein [Chloroflexota bacterium]